MMRTRRGTVMSTLSSLLATLPPGPVPDPGDLERLLASCWYEFKGDDGGMTGQKLLGRMEEVVWQPPILSFTVERHGGTVQGSSRASLQQWRLDLDKKTAWCEERRFRQVRGRQPRLDVRALAEEVASLIFRHQEDERTAQVVRGRTGASPGRQGLAWRLGGRSDPGRTTKPVAPGAAGSAGGRGVAGGRRERLYPCVISLGAALLLVGQGWAGQPMGHTVRRDKLRRDKICLARYT